MRILQVDMAGHWNYRILQYDNGELGIHEVYYNDKGEPDSCTVNPVGIVGSYFEDLKGSYLLMKKAFDKPILQYNFFKDIENKNAC